MDAIAKSTSSSSSDEFEVSKPSKAMVGYGFLSNCRISDMACPFTGPLLWHTEPAQKAPDVQFSTAKNLTTDAFLTYNFMEVEKGRVLRHGCSYKIYIQS